MLAYIEKLSDFLSIMPSMRMFMFTEHATPRKIPMYEKTNIVF